MKKRRSTFWRWLLSLLLGAGTWWGVGWWLSPRVWFKATYLKNEAQRNVKANLPEFEAVDEANLHVKWHAKIWDNSNRYLIIEENWSRELPTFYHIVDLQTGKMIVQHRRIGTDIDFRDRWHASNKAHANGDNFAIKYQSSYSADELTSARLEKRCSKDMSLSMSIDQGQINHLLLPTVNLGVGIL